MELHEMEALIKEAMRDADLHPDEIPAIDLYLDQITSLMAEKRREGSLRFEDRVLTKTMINNYSKDGLISPIKGKKYTKEQILQMLVVYSLKNTLSIGEIKRILQNVYASPDFDGKMLESTYMRFLEIKQSEREELGNFIFEFVEHNGLDISDNADFFTLLLGLSSLSSYLKNIVQILLETRYPDVDAEKKEDAKRQKEKKKSASKASKKDADSEKEGTDAT